MSSARTPMLFAPGVSSQPAYAPGREERLPDIDDRLVAPESQAEIVKGVVVHAMGANPPHATAHSDAAHLFRGCLADGYESAVDMLTRTSVNTDVAPDVSVFRAGIDPVTKGRYLEEIVFEVHDTERIGHATEKAAALVKRGVRRLFCIRVHTRVVFEWSRKDDDWIELDPTSDITDVCFRVPIPVGALIDRVLADDTVAEALLASNNRVLERALTQRLAQGLSEGLGPLTHQFERRLKRAITPTERALLQARLVSLGAARLGDVVLDLDAAALDAWLADSDAR